MSLLVSEEQRDHATKLLKKLRDARGRGQWKRVKSLTRLYLNSHAAKLMAVERAYRQIELHRRPDKAKLPEIAQRLDAWKGTTEPVVVHDKPKNSNPDDFRPICCFGIENRALQYLALSVLEQIADLHPAQYATRGTHAAISAVAEALKKNGPMCAIEVDIQDCYPSFDGTKLPSIIPLPKEMIEHVIISQHLYLVPGNINHSLGPADGEEWEQILLNDALANARRGIPQGSAASPLVAEIALALPLNHVPKLGYVFSYADNALLMATTKNDVVAMSKALCAALKAHPVGHLWPRVTMFAAGEPIDFLGYQLTSKRGKVFIEPTPRNQQKFDLTVSRLLRQLKNPTLIGQQRAAVVRNLKRYTSSWTAAFSICDGVAELRQDLKQRLA
jgi:hypothetical protein